ncbi:phosphoenolpyruvate carboxykinase (ATP) [Streptococcus gallolyticus]|uniref:phosphoenolpyruvate carboxykinase (ATP) n=1 Tax=Streptococcus gallolyticus TaxID=315405 RepID=A0A060RHS4_9STRE|nr:phosphoenolpyruvate carboxykinase (ATP) [Streptococcus gallolyticus]MCY7166029.1 phosphoenolpyruvate carboxykinase (ATP) [Streptococcus gallolyticus subsp. gallolyticus]MCY7172424.1 phosphoenolpyruvate carboxykinase (ATP) [Streptococcus gallolyticus subsp. gallolyticus]MCY7183128.1 phosphoenolpyruvate carboxykinase (ATP) [Streptococcus gallolyticus subsp. gallolyticus]CDO18317.1 Putative carboxykinase [Streptococcus gallolyticus]
MVTRNQFSTLEMRKASPYFSALKTIVETAFYENQVISIKTLEEAYQLASNAAGTVILDMPVIHTKELGLPSYARVLLTNSGAVVGRTAKARRIYGLDLDEDERLLSIVRSAVYQAHSRKFYKADAIVGLDEEFMVRAHLMVPEEEINNLYSWLLNFQILDEEFKNRLKVSKRYDEDDIFVFFDPKWSHPDYPDGLAYFDTNHNCVAILGLNYFGELKKATLTLAWGTAARNGYVSCHGGLKIFQGKEEKNDYVASFFGLSGSGKSTLTHAKHNGKYDIKVLHDDAFIISEKDGSSIALEPSYFDKTNDYPTGHPEQDFFVTVQNCGVTLDDNGRKKLMTEDIRNGNGRTVKSRFATPNRVDHIEEPINAIFWIMKDDSLPPLIKINDPLMAATMGCTLMTKRSSAENIEGSKQSLVIEPFANPFRVYPLVEDYQKFRSLFASGVDCYIINTGFYMGNGIPKEVSLDIIEKIVDGNADFKAFGPIEGFEYLTLEDYPVHRFDAKYKQLIRSRMQIRLNFLLSFNQNNPKLALPVEAISRLERVINNLK